MLIFLRFFYVVGHGGVGHALLIVFLSWVCAFLTGLSLSAIATNGKVERGGAYYLISRALGHRLGGAVGCTYYLGITLLATLETLGAVEVLLAVEPSLALGDDQLGIRVWAAALVAAMGSMVYMGMGFVSKMGVFFAVIVALTLLSYYVGLTTAPLGTAPDAVTGLSADTLRDNWGPEYEDGVNFSIALSVFFPCFTGILSGANRAQALRDPQRSIPLGTLGAICISLCMYVSFMVLWGAVADRGYLKYGAKYLKYEESAEAPADGAGRHLLELVMDLAGGRRLLGGGTESMDVVGAIAWPSALAVQIGIVIASISQALQCLIVAPTLLSAIASDGAVPFLAYASQLSKQGEPQRALIVTMAICTMACMIGSLDMVAPLLSICFLTCYAAMNMSTFALSATESPSWRPTWRYFHWSSALLGFLMCTIMMFLINWYFAIVAVLLVAAMFLYIYLKGGSVDWGSAIAGVRMQLATQAMLQVREEQRFAVNWRPQLLCLHKLHHTHMHTHEEMLTLASQLKGGRGLTMVVEILEGKVAELGGERVRAERELLEQHMAKVSIEGFAQVIVAPSYRAGKSITIQGSGLGGLEPNTILLGWPHNWRSGGKHVDDADVLVETLCECQAMDKAVVLCMHLQDFPTEPLEGGYIDIWWLIHDGGLLLLIAHLLKKHKVWRSCKLRLHTVAEKSDNSDMIKRTLEQLLENVRIKASVEVVELEDDDLLAYTHDWTLRKGQAQAFRSRMLGELAGVEEGDEEGSSALVGASSSKESPVRVASFNNLLPSLRGSLGSGDAPRMALPTDGSITIGSAQRGASKSVVFPQAIDMIAGVAHNERSVRNAGASARRDFAAELQMPLRGRAGGSMARSATVGSLSAKAQLPPSGSTSDLGTPAVSSKRLSLSELTAKMAEEQGMADEKKGGNGAQDDEGANNVGGADAAHPTPSGGDDDERDAAAAEHVEIELSATPVPAPAAATLDLSDDPPLPEPSAFEQLSLESQNTMGKELAASLKEALAQQREGAGETGDTDSSDHQVSYDGDNDTIPAYRRSRSLRLPSNRKVSDLHERAAGAAGPMHLNAKIRENSDDSALIILNLPDPDALAKERPERYMRYVEMLTKNLDRVLLIHGSGREVWTGDT